MVDHQWLRQRARELRAEMPSAEALLWTLLRRRQLAGLKFRRQHVLGNVIVDFYCPERRLAVEVDGPTHDAEEDNARDDELAKAHIEVLRFTNEEVFRYSIQVAADIERRALQRPPRTARSIHFPNDD